MAFKCPKCYSEILDDSRFCSKCGTPIHAAEEELDAFTRTLVTPSTGVSLGSLLADKYRLLEEIGHGGMGIVYKAEDMKLKRLVAIKFLPRELSSKPEARERFIQEARAAAALSHPNICTIHEVDESEDKPFIVMEYVEGENLREKIKKGPLPIEEALDITIQAADGLEKAHQRGVVHRDIKSANIMVTGSGQAKIMDFGLAKLRGGTAFTKEGATLGTVAYMSPEQARGEKVDVRTDIWSLGVVLYEMLTSELPFKGEREVSILYSIVHEEPKPLKVIRPDIPPELQQLIGRALNKNPDSRYQSAAEMVKDLRKFQEVIKVEASNILNLRSLWKRFKRPVVAVPSVIVFMALALFAFWFFNHQAKVRWAEERAIPEIVRFVEDGNSESAYNLAVRAERYAAKDPRLKSLWPSFARQVNIKTDPPGAKVYRKFYDALGKDWEYLGKTPIDSIRFPLWYSRVRFEKPGFRTVQAAVIYSSIRDKLIKLDRDGSIPDEMVRVCGGDYSLNIPGLDHLPAVRMDDYLIDKYEVSNREFKRFVNSGGYAKREYWKFPFKKNGQVLSWDEAMAEFTDKTGRTGPAGWEAGDFPSGQDNYPVTGVSWYEAAAYAEFAVKSLPTIYHWNVAADTAWLSPIIIPVSNFSDRGLAPVGQYQGMSTYGVYDMAGNAREWCTNESGERRFILGGGWNDQTYMFNDAFAQPAFDRSLTNGFRCIKYLKEQENLAALQKPIDVPHRDFISEKPVSDEVFRIYKKMYAYDKTDLKATAESKDDTEKDWIKEKVSFSAAYGGERVTAYLFLPRSGRPPYQTIIYFPGSNAIHERSSESLTGRNFDFLLKNGRAVIFPVYKSTYERGDDLDSDYPDETIFYKEHVIMWGKDLSRSIDYLETRQDIDATKLAYYGVSWGGATGAIVPAVESRINVVILNVAGLSFQRALPEVDAINYVSRVTVPVLMLNGRHDHFFPIDTSQIPMFKLLGTPPENKRQIIYDSGHIVPRNQVIKEMLEWLDRYFGPVNR
jgi:formylglycine-generating enzyme required for sulfatase activity/predicted Ser/Thr protein kinase/dienelactone hydrolase